MFENRVNGNNHHTTPVAKINSVLLTQAYRQSRLGQITSLFCATIIFLGLFNPNDFNWTLMSWYVAFCAVTLGRILLTQYYCRQTQIVNPKPWVHGFRIGALLGGICWGLVGGLLFRTSGQVEQILIVLILAGVTAGSVPLLAGELISALLFLSSALVPLIANLFIFENHVYFLFGFSSMVYFLYLFALCIKTNSMIKNSIALQFQNDDLLRDLTKAKYELELSNKKLEEAATHDPLTAVANRKLFQDYIEKLISLDKGNKKVFALLYIDIDNFKYVNDVYGHHVGDRLLQKLVRRIKEVAQNNLIARLGGDELIVLVEEIYSLDEIAQIANKLCIALARNVEVNTIKITVSASIGISIYPIDGIVIEELLKKADSAMYYVKANGNNSYHFATPLELAKILLTDKGLIN